MKAYRDDARWRGVALKWRAVGEGKRVDVEWQHEVEWLKVSGWRGDGGAKGAWGEVEGGGGEHLGRHAAVG